MRRKTSNLNDRSSRNSYSTSPLSTRSLPTSPLSLPSPPSSKTAAVPLVALFASVVRPSLRRSKKSVEKPSASESPRSRKLSKPFRTPPPPLPRRRRSSAARPRRSVCSKRFEVRNPLLGIAVSAAPLAWSVLCVGIPTTTVSLLFFVGVSEGGEEHGLGKAEKSDFACAETVAQKGTKLASGGIVKERNTAYAANLNHSTQAIGCAAIGCAATNAAATLKLKAPLLHQVTRERTPSNETVTARPSRLLPSDSLPLADGFSKTFPKTTFPDLLMQPLHIRKPPPLLPTESNKTN